LALAEVGGAVLVVSQFTLYGDARKGRGRHSIVPGVPWRPPRSRAHCGQW
jgi:D-Tyr-tRNAtyr deacylase